jgi:hypothetical protein
LYFRPGAQACDVISLVLMAYTWLCKPVQYFVAFDLFDEDDEEEEPYLTA